MKWFVLAVGLAFTSPALAWPSPCCTDVEWAVWRNIPNHIRDMSDSAWFTAEYKKWAQTLPSGNVKDAYLKWITYLEDERAKLKLDEKRNTAIKELIEQVTIGACVSGWKSGTIPRVPEIKCQTMRQ